MLTDEDKRAAGLEKTERVTARAEPWSLKPDELARSVQTQQNIYVHVTI